MEIKTLVRKIRGERSRAELADELGVSRQMVNYWENGRSVPGEKMLAKLGIKEKRSWELVRGKRL